MLKSKMALMLGSETAETAQKCAETSQDPFIVMLVGMAVVFIGLIIIICVVKLVSLIYRALFVGKEEALPAANTNTNTGAALPASGTRALTDAQRGETVAAIAAAVAESLGKPVSGIRIKSIRKLG